MDRKRKAEEKEKEEPQPKKKKEQNNVSVIRQRLQNNEYAAIIQIDPGNKLTLATVIIDVESNREINFNLPAKTYHHLNKKGLRYREMKKRTANLLTANKDVLAEYELIPSKKNEKFYEYSDSTLRLFNARSNIFYQNKFSRFKFDAFVNKQKTIDSVCKHIIGANGVDGRSLVIIGNNQASSNSPMKGHQRTPYKNAWQRQFETMNGVDVLEGNEFNSTKACSFCPKFNTVSQSPHRLVKYIIDYFENV